MKKLNGDGKFTLQCAVTMVALLGVIPSAYGQQDMWTNGMLRAGLFTPHTDNCDPLTEAFVPITPNQARGYCIEIDERQSAPWVEARQTCVSERKRLPEPGEYQFACLRAATLGLNDVEGAPGEWVSNFTTTSQFSSGSNTAGVIVPTMGNPTCEHASFQLVGGNDGNTTAGRSSPFRCVR